MTIRTRLDLFKRYRNEYVAPKQPRLIQVEPAQYLDIAASDESDGLAPDALEKALYAVVSVLRTVTTDVHQRDFILGKLEWLLRDDDAEREYPCKVMMRVPDFVTSDDVSHAVAVLLARGPDAATAQWVRQAHLSKSTKERACKCCTPAPTIFTHRRRRWRFCTTLPKHKVLQR